MGLTLRGMFVVHHRHNGSACGAASSRHWRMTFFSLSSLVLCSMASTSCLGDQSPTTNATVESGASLNLCFSSSQAPSVCWTLLMLMTSCYHHDYSLAIISAMLHTSHHLSPIGHLVHIYIYKPPLLHVMTITKK